MPDLLPEFAAVVEALARQGPVSLTGVDWSQVPAPDRAARTLPAPGVVDVADATVPAPQGSVPVRTYTPRGRPSPGWPALVWMHGGAWTGGGLDEVEADGVARELSARAGGVVVSVGYRLAPAHRFPAALDDVAAVVAWLASGSSGLAVDPGRVVVGGASAGGNLAAGYALRARDGIRRGAPGLAGQLLVYPVLRPPAAGGEGDPAGAPGAAALLAPGTVAAMWRAYLGDDADLDAPHPYAAPGAAPDLAGVAPAAVVVAAFDPFRPEGEEYGAALARAGVPVDIAVAERTIHGYLGFVGVLPALDGELDRLAACLRALWTRRAGN